MKGDPPLTCSSCFYAVLLMLYVPPVLPPPPFVILLNITAPNTFLFLVAVRMLKRMRSGVVVEQSEFHYHQTLALSVNIFDQI